MANEEKKLAVDVIARIDKLEKGMAKAASVVSQRASQIEARAKTMAARFDAVGAGMATRIAGAFAAAASLKAATQLIDAASRIQNALKVAGLAGDELRGVYGKLFESAQKNAAPIESLVTLYGRLALVQKELGVDQGQLVEFTDNVALALRVAGTDATAASGALLQLSQALGGGVVRAEEFNSVLEGAPTIAQAVAAGLKEANGSVSELRNLVVDGKVSSQAFFAAFEAGAATLEGKVAGSTLTVAQRMQQLENALVDAAGKINDATDASGKLGEGINQLAMAVSALGKMLVDVANSDVGVFIGKITEATGQVQSLLGFLGGIPGALDKIGKIQTDIITGQPIGTTIKDSAAKANEDRIQKRIDDAFAADPTTGRLPATPAAAPAPVQQVSIADYAVPTKPKGGGGGGRKRGGGGGGSDPFASSVESIKEQTAALQAAYVAQAALNPLTADYAMQLEKAQAKQELLAAAQKAGREVTPALSAEIDALASAYANASDAADKLAQKHEDIKAAADDAMSTAKDVTKGLITDLASGTDAADAFRNALSRIADKLLDGALDQLFGTGGSSGGGLLGTLLGGLFGGIGKNANGTPNWKGGLTVVGERGPEIVNIPQGAAIIPNHRISAPVMPSVSPRGTSSVTKNETAITVQIQGANGDDHVLALVRQGVSQGISTHMEQQRRGGFGTLNNQFAGRKG